jgi:polyisoprenyl-teichoic acid--peptidoglycan teichoic acid transferase
MLPWGIRSHPRSALAALAAVSVMIGLLLALWITSSSQPDPPPAAAAHGPAEPSPTPTLTPRPSPATPTPLASTPTPSPSPTPEPSEAAGEDGLITILVLGSDSDARRRAQGKGGLMDAITVVSARTDGSAVALFSLPRDTADVPMPGGGTWTRKVNSLAPALGPAAMRDSMSVLLGIHVDHYVMVDMDDFRRIVDAVGGVSVHVPRTLTDRRCTIAAGTQHLDGQLALCYARHRATDSDYARAARHQHLLVALRDRVLSGGIDLASLLPALGSLRTDIGLADLPALVEVARRSQNAEASMVVLSPPAYTIFAGSTPDRGWISIPNVAAIRQTVGALVGNSSVAGTDELAPTSTAQPVRRPAASFR